MYGGNTPILVLKEGTSRESGKDARKNNISAAIAVADAVRSTLGPKGMDKMLVDSLGDVVITNDGVTILKELDIEHPAAKMLVEVAKTQDQECGDGTTTAVIFSGELLKKAESLLESNVHPTVIATGYKKAAEKATTILNEIAEDLTADNEDILKKIAMTSVTGKSAEGIKEKMAEISVKAVKAVSEEREGHTVVDLNNIKIEKKIGGSLEDTALIEGIVLDKERVHVRMPDVVDNAKIALIDSALEVKKTEIDAKIEIKDPSQLQAFLNEEEKMLKDMVSKIKDVNANVVICQKGIDDMAQHFLAKEGIYAVRRAKKSDMQKLARATGGKVVTNIKELSEEDLGTAERVEERKVGDDKMTFITGCKAAKALTILIRGGTEHAIDEIERSLNDSLNVVAVALKDGKYVMGGGSAATELSMKLKEWANTVSGREQLAIQAFADALEIVPKTLAENAGHDPVDVLLNLRKAHADGKKYHGLNAWTGKIVDMKSENVIEPIRVGKQAIASATDASVMLLRIDDVIASKKSSGGTGAAPGMGGDMGGMGGYGGMGGMM